jgi:hypothetical protein
MSALTCDCNFVRCWIQLSIWCSFSSDLAFASGTCHHPHHTLVVVGVSCDDSAVNELESVFEDLSAIIIAASVQR